MTPLKIGIVEDDFIIAAAISEMLAESGYSVTMPARRYGEAMAMIEAEQPDLLLLDVTIQGRQDGIEVARSVRHLFGIPFIFLTAYADRETISRAKDVAPSAFLAKPVTRAQLHAAIEIAFANFISLTDARDAAPVLNRAATKGLIVKEGETFRRILFSELLFAESRENYVRLGTRSGTDVLIRCTLSGFLKEAVGFIQTHRGFAVALDSVGAFSDDEVRVGGRMIPLSKTYRAAFKQALLRR